MEVIDFCDRNINANTFLVINNEECIVFDPANNIDVLKRYIGDRKLVGVFLTHGHYDHFKELGNLLKYFDTKVFMHKKAYDKLIDHRLSCANFFSSDLEIHLEPNQYFFIQDAETYDIGSFKIKTLFLPGHTNCSVGYLIDKMLFSGDVLFEDSIGRYDLPTASYPATMETIRRLKAMDDDIIIYPGHDSSFKLGEAKQYNRYMN